MRECITHHFACDCREEKFKATEKENAALKAKLEKLKDGLIWIREYYGDKASIGGHHTFPEYKIDLKNFVVNLIREGE